jgi:signal transduction histidine kinase
MFAELSRIDVGWFLSVSLGAALMVQGLLAGRRRTALNEALHELRRPLQALFLITPIAALSEVSGGDLPGQAAAALERLDREINGDPEPAARRSVTVSELVAAAVDRCRPEAEAANASLRCEAIKEGGAVCLDPGAVGQALDNLIINAVRHGGPQIVVAASAGGSRLRFTVRDVGGAPPRESPAVGSRGARSGRRRHGHGLRVVRRVAADHGGRFRLRRGRGETEAVLELALGDREGAG